MKKPARSTAKGKTRAALRRNRAVVLPVMEPAAAVNNVAEPILMAEPEAFYLKLDASCTLRETADLQFSLVAASGEPLVVDGGGVERVDTAGLQLLVALARRQRAGGGSLEWKGVSAELRKCSDRLGLRQELGLPAQADAP